MMPSAAEHEYQASGDHRGADYLPNPGTSWQRWRPELTPTRAELKLVEAATTGAIADRRSSKGIENDPAKGDQWGEERTVSASVIYSPAIANDHPRAAAPM